MSRDRQPTHQETPTRTLVNLVLVYLRISFVSETQCRLYATNIKRPFRHNLRHKFFKLDFTLLVTRWFVVGRNFLVKVVTVDLPGGDEGYPTIPERREEGKDKKVGVHNTLYVATDTMTGRGWYPGTRGTPDPVEDCRGEQVMNRVPE